MTADPYKLAGVDREAGDNQSKVAAKVCIASWSNNPYVQVDDESDGLFRGLRGYDIVDLKFGYKHSIFPDGIGTKVEVITAALAHSTAGFDLMAMTCDDASVKGALPLVAANVLDVATLGEADTPTNNAFIELVLGYGVAAHHAQVVILSGETAELGLCVGSEDPDAITKFNWAGMVNGVYYKGSTITGATISEGMAIVALREYGPRSNYLSAIRRGLRLHFGSAWYKAEEARESVKAAALPSTVYTPLLTKVHGWYSMGRSPMVKMHGAMHITGGGIEAKLGKDILFPGGHSAVLDDLWDIPQILVDTVKWTDATDRNLYEGSSAGNGVLVVMEEKDVHLFCDTAEEMGYEAKCCGVVTKETHPQIRLISRLPGETEVVYKAT